MHLGRNIGKNRMKLILLRKIKKTQYMLYMCRKELVDTLIEKSDLEADSKTSSEYYFLATKEEELTNYFIPKYKAKLEKLYNKYERLTGKKHEEDEPQKQ